MSDDMRHERQGTMALPEIKFRFNEIKLMEECANAYVSVVGEYVQIHLIFSLSRTLYHTIFHTQKKIGL